MMRWLMRAALAALVLLGLLVLMLPWLAAPTLRAGLRTAGYEWITFDELDLGFDHLEVAGLKVGSPAEQEVARVHIAFKPWHLLAGELARVEVSGLRLRGRLSKDGIRLTGIERGEGGEGAGWPPLPRFQHVAVRDAMVELDTPWGAVRLPFAAELSMSEAALAFSLAASDAVLEQEKGVLRLALDLHGRLPLTPAPSLQATLARGTLQIAGEDLTLPAGGQGLRVAGALDFGLEEGEARVTTRGLDLVMAEPAPQLAALAGTLTPPWQLQLGEEAGVFMIEAKPAGQDWAFGLHGPMALWAANGALKADLATGLVFADDLGLREIRSAQAKIAASDLELGSVRAKRVQVAVQGAGTPEDVQGRIEIDLVADGEPAPSLKFAGLALRQSLDVALTRDRLRLTPSAPGSLTFGRLSAPGVRAASAALRLEPAERPLLDVMLADGGIASWSQAQSATITRMAVSVAAGERPLALTSDAGRVALTLRGDAAGALTGEVQLEGAALALPEQALRLAGMRTRLLLQGPELAPGQTIALDVASIRHTGSPPAFEPLRLRAEFRPKGERLPFTARLSDTQDRFRLVLVGMHDLARGHGRATVDVPAVTFAPDGLQPAAIVPALGSALNRVGGTVALAGEVAWADGDIGADLDLLLQDLAFTAGPARLERVNGVVTFDQVWPPATLPGQQLAIGLADFGLALSDGVMIFELAPSGELKVARLRFQWAGGMLRADPFTLSSEDLVLSTILHAERLDLAQIFQQVRLPGLSGEGTINGVLPVRLAGAQAVIDRGELKAARPGVLRYRPDQAPAALSAGGASMSLLLQALENFRYEALRITLDGRTDAAMDIGLHLRGANPDLYDGHPVEFNLNLEGELANILRTGLSSYRIPERIRERMQGFRR